jgi:hypothetical protein
MGWHSFTSVLSKQLVLYGTYHLTNQKDKDFSLE